MTEADYNNVWKHHGAFKPISPMSMNFVHTASLVRGPHNSVRLFILESTGGKDESKKQTIINPKNGKTKYVDVEKYAEKVGKKDENDGSPVEIIDTVLVKQITMVLFDQSSSMNIAFDGYEAPMGAPTRTHVAQQFLTSWSNKSFGYRVSSFQGLISFNKTHKIVTPLSPLVPDFEKGVLSLQTQGGTLLWDTILFAANILTAKKNEEGGTKFPNASLRILIISDGDDQGSKLHPWTILPILLENNIIVDCVIVSKDNMPYGKINATLESKDGEIILNMNGKEYVLDRVSENAKENSSTSLNNTVINEEKRQELIAILTEQQKTIEAQEKELADLKSQRRSLNE